MSVPRVKWGQAKRYFERHNYQIDTDGGDKLIREPKDSTSKRLRKVVRIGHKFCTSYGDELLSCHLSNISRKFGVSWQDILNE